MRTLTKTLLTTAAIAAALAPAASADTTVAAAPGARNLAGAGGWLAWSEPTGEGRWRLTLRAPDGTVSRPATAAFDVPARPSFGTTANFGPQRRLVAVYTRAGDAYELDLRTGAERRLRRLSTSARETAVAISGGQFVVVRSGGARRGLYAVSRSGRSRRLTTTVPAQIAMSPARVASIEGTGSGRKVVVRRLSGRGRPLVAARRVASASSLWLTRYRAGWATSAADGTRRVASASSLWLTRYRAGWATSAADGSRLFATRRFAGSGGPFTLSVIRDAWTSASPLYGIVLSRHAEPGLYLDAEGVKRFDPVPFHAR